MAVGVHALLHERRMPEDEVQDRDSALLGIRSALVLERRFQRRRGGRWAQAKRVGAQHELGSVPVGEEGVADASRCRQDSCSASGDDRRDAVGEVGEEFLLAREVPIESAGLHLESGRDASHREVGEPYLVEQSESRAGHAVAVVPCRIVFGAHALTIVNSVQVNGVQEAAVSLTTELRKDDMTRSSATKVSAIMLDQVSVEFDGRAVLQDVTIELRAPTIAVIGANGSGKSTFARLLNGLVAPTSGRVLVQGMDATRDRAAVRRRVGFVFADPEAQILMPTPAEDLALSLRGRPRDEMARCVAETLAAHGLADHADVPASTLSGGQKQMLALASVLITEPDLIVADEPTTLLDLRNARRIGDLLLAQSAQVVLVTHDLELAARCEVAVLFDHGRITASGEPSEVIDAYRRGSG